MALGDPDCQPSAPRITARAAGAVGAGLTLAETLLPMPACPLLPMPARPLLPELARLLLLLLPRLMGCEGPARDSGRDRNSELELLRRRTACW
jgi:hypothetical protein